MNYELKEWPSGLVKRAIDLELNVTGKSVR